MAYLFNMVAQYDDFSPSLVRRVSKFKSYTLIVIIFVSIILLFAYYLRSESFTREFKPDEIHKTQSNQLAIWPEDDPYDDRILAQLAIKVDTDAPIKTIYLSTSDFPMPYGDKLFVDSGCNVQQCSIISNRANADVVLWKHRISMSRKDVPPEQIWILFTLESPFHEGFVNPDGVVNWTATYRRDSDIPALYGKWVYYDNNIRRIRNSTVNYAKGKKKKVAMFVSNCHHQNNNRLQYARSLNEYIPVDIYGRCGVDTCKKDREKECLDMLKTSYKFYLAFENSNCRDYITEKFFVNGLASNIIPIVMGAYPEDYKVGPEHSYIHVDDFPSVEALAEYLQLVDSNDELYNSYFQWKDTGEFINTKFFCRLCAMLHSPRPPKTYTSFKEWWNGDGICPTKSGFL